MSTEQKTVQNKLGSEPKINAPNIENFNLFDSREFKDDIANYSEFSSSKAMAIAFDHKGRWIMNFRHNHRTQEAANIAAIEDCNRARIKQKIVNSCVLFLVAHELTGEFAKNEMAVKATSILDKENFETLSIYESTIAEYEKLAPSKALAISENQDGGYYLYRASAWKTQKDAEDTAQKYCDINKPDLYPGRCRILMRGEHFIDDAPRLENLTGIWKGQFKDYEIESDGKLFYLDDVSVVVDNCFPYPRVYFGVNSDQKPYLINRIWDVSEEAGKAILSSLSKGKTWEDVQTWTLVRVGEAKLMVSRSRVFKNLDLQGFDPSQLQTFLGSGVVMKEANCE